MKGLRSSKPQRCCAGASQKSATVQNVMSKVIMLKSNIFWHSTVTLKAVFCNLPQLARNGVVFLSAPAIVDLYGRRYMYNDHKRPTQELASETDVISS